MKRIAVDTCGPVLGVALADGDAIWLREERVQRGAEALLMPWILALCAEAGISLREVEGVAVAHGPGAFTGLRVGLATAAGVAQGLRVPIWSTSSLEARAAGERSEVPTLVLLDARKGRAYAALFGPDGALLRGPADVAPEIALAWIESPFLATGEGALVWEREVIAAGGVLSTGAESSGVRGLIRLAQAALAAGEGHSPEAVQPVYLREPDAVPPTRAPAQE